KFLYSLLVYIYGTTELQPEEVEEVVKQIAKGKEDVAMTTAERLVQQGLEQGLQQGEYKKAIETARRMKERGYPIEDILSLTGLTERDLKENGIL
ncbi:MAG: transposase, partial [Candidatus Hydrogenedentota bacterium]